MLGATEIRSCLHLYLINAILSLVGSHFKNVRGEEGGSDEGRFRNQPTIWSN